MQAQLSFKRLARAELHGQCHRLSCLTCTRPRVRTRSSNNGTGEGVPNLPINNAPKVDEQWQDLAFPTYLQSEVDDFCQDWDEALQLEERRQSDISHRDGSKVSRGAVTGENPVWQAIRKEAVKDAAQEPILSSFLYASVLSHDSFEMALAAILANRLSDPTMMATELIDIFHSVLRGSPEVEQAALADVIAVRERDPACTAYSSALLYYKGYHALQTHRIAHGLWERGQRVLARSLQYRCTQTLAVDIHPAAKIGKGVLLDHGTGLVIGETAVVGNNVSILHNVTLGGTGKEVGDRHPKVSANVLIGANATILGNISIGKGAQVAAGSLVLKDVPPRTMVAGSPAKEVGKVTGNPALKMQHWMKNQLVKESYAEKREDIVRSGHTNSASQASESKLRLPAEFGAKDKVPAKGTAPMGPSDYADGSQWTARDGTMQRHEDGQASNSNSNSSSKNSDSSSASHGGAVDRGYVGGDGASANGAVRQSPADASNQSHSSNGVSRSDGVSLSEQQKSEIQELLASQPQKSGHLPDQAKARESSRDNGAAPPGSLESRPARIASSGNDGASSSGGKDSTAPSDSDWWREVTEASKKADCKDVEKAMTPKNQVPKASSMPVEESQAKSQAEQDIFGSSQNGNGSNTAAKKSAASQNGAAARNLPRDSASQRGISGGAPSDELASSSSPGFASMQTPAASDKSSRATPHSPEEEADMKKKKSEAEEVASKLEGQLPESSQKAQVNTTGKQSQQPLPQPADFEYWI